MKKFNQSISTDRFFTIRPLLKLRIIWMLSILLLLVSCAQIELPLLKKDQPEPEHTSFDTPEIELPQSPRFDYPLHVDTLLKHMSLDEKIGQLFFTSANGYFKNVDDPEYQRLKRRVQEDHIGGIILFRGNVYGQAMLINKLQSMSKIPLWVTQDMENGAAMRISGTTRFTPAMGIAATGNPENAYTAGKITAMEAKALGVHQIYAPVLDVNNNPLNPVINVRSFSENPQTVSTYGTKFIEGVKSEGLVSTAKHFPGHGDTDTDSHTSLPIVNHNYTQLDTIELVPFKSAINSGIPSIMSAHISFPQISENPGLPSTLDASILKRILIDSLNFNGVVVTDGLRMRGVSSNYSPGEAVIKALKAGADMMLLSPDETTAIYEIKAAVQRGVISEERIDQSVRKLLKWKLDHGLFENASIDLEELNYHIDRRQFNIESERIARESITLLKNKNDLLPIRSIDYPKIMVLALADDQSGYTGSYLARKVRDYHDDVKFHIYDKRTSEDDRQRMLRNAREADLLIFGSFIHVETNKNIQMSPQQIDFTRKLIGMNKPSALIAFGNPYVLHDLPETDVHMIAWSSSSQQIAAAVPGLFGASNISGKLPISIPDLYTYGDGLTLPHTTVRLGNPGEVQMSADTLQQIDRLMEQAVRDSVFPGGVVGIVKDGVLVHNQGYGYHTYNKLREVKDNDVYDLASLTKIVATTTAVMRLVDDGKLDLEDRVSKYIPEFKQGDKKKIRIKNLLLHNSGLPPFRTYVDDLKNREEILNAVKNEPLINRPFREYVYSDLGFILLADIVEQITGQRLDRYMRKDFYYPLGMPATHFNPSRLGQWMKDRIPPTEIDTVFRNETVNGVVHDERAYYMDGVAGHAGLFSSARDLAVYAQMLLNKGSYAGEQYLSEEVISEFTRRQSPQNNRGFGFDRKSEGFSTAGSKTSENTYGHLGFTGTSLWVDPEHNIAVILLTNRTYPYRSYGDRINEIRTKVADIAVSGIKE